MQVSDLRLGLRMMRGSGPETEINIIIPLPFLQEVDGPFSNQMTVVQNWHIKVVLTFANSFGKNSKK